MRKRLPTVVNSFRNVISN